jgi:hypothetical protein
MSRHRTGTELSRMSLARTSHKYKSALLLSFAVTPSLCDARARDIRDIAGSFPHPVLGRGEREKRKGK